MCCVTETEPAAVSYHFPLYTGETKLAASDVASFHTGHRWIHLSTRNSTPLCKRQKCSVSRGEHNIHRYLKNNQKGTRRYSRFGCAARQCIFQQTRFSANMRCHWFCKTFIDKFESNIWALRSVEICALCKSRRELSNEAPIAMFGIDTAENEHFKIWLACPGPPRVWVK